MASHRVEMASYSILRFFLPYICTQEASEDLLHMDDETESIDNRQHQKSFDATPHEGHIVAACMQAYLCGNATLMGFNSIAGSRGV